MDKTRWGKTGLMVTRLGFGAAELGYRGTPKDQSYRVLEGVLDAGINLIDTGECYADSEEKIGASISRRRDEFVLVSKWGHKVDPDDGPEWSVDLMTKSVERSLRRMRTDHLDVLLLHSCPAEFLDRQEMMRALEDCKARGKARFIGYSGDREAALKAAGMAVFDVMETSVNICDQHCLSRHLPQARKTGLGVLAKRPIANAAWQYQEEPSKAHEYVRPYATRLHSMGFTPQSLGLSNGWMELALRFSAYQPGVHCAIVGSTNMEHVLDDLRAVEAGPLPDAIVEAIKSAWARCDDGSWTGQT